MSRHYTLTPEERAEALHQHSPGVSGYTYISVVLRETRDTGKVPYIPDSAQCDHAHTMCPSWECIESWSLDYKVLLHRTVAGRRLAGILEIDAVKFALHQRQGIERLSIENFRVNSS